MLALVHFRRLHKLQFGDMMQTLFQDESGNVLMNPDGTVMFDETCCCGCPVDCSACLLAKVVVDLPSWYLYGFNNFPVTVIRDVPQYPGSCRWYGQATTVSLGTVSVFVSCGTDGWSVSLIGTFGLTPLFNLTSESKGKGASCPPLESYAVSASGGGTAVLS